VQFNKVIICLLLSAKIPSLSLSVKTLEADRKRNIWTKDLGCKRKMQTTCSV
jgi:hypothetical protein